MKKLIAMAACATLVMSTFTVAADSFVAKYNGVDVVSAASETTPAKPATPSKSSTKSTKTTTTKKTSTTQTAKPTIKYKDGSYTAFGEASTHGSERADITIKNGKLASVKLYKLLPSLKDGAATYFYKQAPKAAPVMAGKFLKNETYFTEMTKADTVSGATSSSKSWNLAVSRALEKATSSDKMYFDGTFAGVDSQSRVLVLLDLQNYKLTNVEAYILDPKGDIVIDAFLTPQQKQIMDTINQGLLKSGAKMKDIKGAEYFTAAAKAAYMNALANASASK